MKTTRLLAASATAVVLALGMTACGSDDADDDVVPAATSAPSSTESAPMAESPSAGSTAGDGDDVTDADLRGQLEKVALDEVGQGRVTDVEHSDDRDHAYEVEVDLGNDDDDDVSVEIAEDLSVVRVDR